MRLWSIHPKYLDTQGLLAVWREGLLARKVLAGQTKGYRNHPQLIRFMNSGNPLDMINWYLFGIYEESKLRQYRFDILKLAETKNGQFEITVTAKQVRYEFELLKTKLIRRNYPKYCELIQIENIELHPLFRRIVGEIETWEKAKPEILELLENASEMPKKSSGREMK